MLHGMCSIPFVATGWVSDIPAPLCKGSRREATEGLSPSGFAMLESSGNPSDTAAPCYLPLHKGGRCRCICDKPFSYAEGADARKMHQPLQQYGLLVFVERKTYMSFKGRRVPSLFRVQTGAPVR